MSQTPGPPLNTVPTNIKKRKLKKNLPTISNPESSPSNNNNNNDNNNNNSNETNPASPSQPSVQIATPPSSPASSTQNQSEQQMPESNIPSSSPHPPNSISNPEISLSNANENIKNSTSLGEMNQQNQTDVPKVVSISSLGPIKKRKKIGSASVTVSDTSSEAPPASPTQLPTVTPIETNEIPDIDVMNDSNDSLRSIHSGNRLGLDIEQDNALSARYMNPNFDLSKIGKNESRQILNKSISKEYAERFTRDMTAREEQFRKEYVKPKEKEDEQLVNATFLKSELNTIIENLSKNVQSHTDKFDISKCNFKGLTVSEENSFKPNLSGLAKTYTMNSQEAINSLSGKQELTSIEEMKTELNADFLNVSQNSEENDEDFISEIKSLFNQSNKQVSPTEFVIDLSTPESVKLICQIARFFSSGLRCQPSVLFTRLYSQMNEDSRGRANIVSLQSALLQAKSSIVDVNGSYRITVYYILHLIRLAQCSALLRYMSGLLAFKKNNYYNDALILDADLCLKLSNEVEKIECVKILGGLMPSSITENVPAVPGDRFALCVSGVVDSYLRETRNLLIQGVEANSDHDLPLIEVLKIFVKSFLLQKNGSCLSVDALYEIFDLIANLSEQNNAQNAQQANLSPCCEHPAYKRFVEIFRGKDVTRFWDTKSKVWATIVALLNEKILPYIILFGVSIPQTKTTMNPAYFRDPLACLRIAHALLPMKFPTFNIRYESIKKDVSTLD